METCSKDVDEQMKGYMQDKWIVHRDMLSMCFLNSLDHFAT